MTNEEIDNCKYKVCCPMCDLSKCIKGSKECEAEIWAKQKKLSNIITRAIVENAYGKGN